MWWNTLLLSLRHANIVRCHRFLRHASGARLYMLPLADAGSLASPSEGAAAALRADGGLVLLQVREQGGGLSWKGGLLVWETGLFSP